MNEHSTLPGPVSRWQWRRWTAYLGLACALSIFVQTVSAVWANSQSDPSTAPNAPLYILLLLLFVMGYLPIVVLALFSYALRELIAPPGRPFLRFSLGLFIQLQNTFQAIGFLFISVIALEGDRFLEPEVFATFISVVYGWAYLNSSLWALLVAWEWQALAPMPSWGRGATFALAGLSFVMTFAEGQSQLGEAISVLALPVWVTLFSAWLYVYTPIST
jgi:hypothetical protein